MIMNDETQEFTPYPSPFRSRSPNLCAGIEPASFPGQISRCYQRMRLVPQRGAHVQRPGGIPRGLGHR